MESKRRGTEDSSLWILTYSFACVHQGSSVAHSLRHVLGRGLQGRFLHCLHPGPAVGWQLSTRFLAGRSDLSSVVSPVPLQCNQIHHGLRSGIVVLGNGKGVIRNNQIFSNKEAGIYILYHGNPVVRYVCCTQTILSHGPFFPP